MSSVLSRLDSPELRASIYQFTVYLPGGVASVFLGIWLSERGIPADQIGVINALPTLALLLLNIIVGRVADKADDWRTALIVLSILSARYWPIWMTALQGCVALSHLVGFRRDIIAWAYGTMVASWSYMLLAILAIATWRHIRRRSQFGIDPSWSWELPEAYRRSR